MKLLELSGGSHLAFDEYGDRRGVPVFFCHGWPSSRMMAQLTDEPARELGVRIISPDRPGLSGCALQMNRKLADWPPELLRICFRCFRPFGSRRIPIRLRPLFLKIFQPMDAAVLRDNAAFECCFESARRAWRGSAEGVMLDAQVYAEPWGFKLEDVDVPVRLWHGIQDRAFSFRVAEEVAKRLPNCKARYIDKAGHY